MRKSIFFIIWFVILFAVSGNQALQLDKVSNPDQLYFGEPDQLLDIRLEIVNKTSLTNHLANVSIFSPTEKVLNTFNQSITSVTHLWFGWRVPADAMQGNYSIFAFEYDTLTNTSVVIVVRIPYVITIIGYVLNSYGNAYPSYPVEFLNLNRTEFLIAETDATGFYSMILHNTTIGNHLYGFAKVQTEESSVIVEVDGNFTMSFRTQPVEFYNGGNVGIGGGSADGRARAIAQRDGIFFGAIAVTLISLGGLGAMIYKVGKI